MRTKSLLLADPDPFCVYIRLEGVGYDFVLRAPNAHALRCTKFPLPAVASVLCDRCPLGEARSAGTGLERHHLTKET